MTTVFAAMSSLVLGLGLAVLASLALNASYLLQHAGSRDAPAVSVRRPLASLGQLLRSRWWLAGSAAGAAGWALHIGALAHAPLSLVQAFAAGGLALTVPAAARAFRQRLARAELVAVLVLVAALALLGVGASAPVLATVPAVSLAVSLALAAATAGALAARVGGSRRGHMLGAAAGVLYGAGDAATKAVTVAAHAGLGAVLTSPWLAAVVVLSVAAFICFQRGLQIGPAVPVIALMTATTNAAAILIGLLAFREPLGASPAFGALHLVAFVLAGAAGLQLAAAQGRMAPQATAEPAVPAAPRRATKTATAPSTNASACSTPPSPVEGATTPTKAPIATSAASRSGLAHRPRPAAASAPAAPAHTHEIP
jgi:drug/metabolite transporter (DMT)-like permease